MLAVTPKRWWCGSSGDASGSGAAAVSPFGPPLPLGMRPGATSRVIASNLDVPAHGDCFARVRARNDRAGQVCREMTKLPTAGHPA
jgi:hypothetical protein